MARVHHQHRHSVSPAEPCGRICALSLNSHSHSNSHSHLHPPPLFFSSPLPCAQEYHQETLDNLRVAMRNTKRLCCTMLDTLSNEIMVLNRPETASISLNAGETITLTTDRTRPASSSCLPISYPSFQGSGLAPGAQVFVGQYLFTGSETSSVYLTVQEVGAGQPGRQGRGRARACMQLRCSCRHMHGPRTHTYISGQHPRHSVKQHRAHEPGHFPLLLKE